MGLISLQQLYAQRVLAVAIMPVVGLLRGYKKARVLLWIVLSEGGDF